MGVIGLFRKVVKKPETVEEMAVRAEKGDATLQFKLAVRFSEGVDAPQDYMSAAKWFRRAAAQGHVLAQYNFAVLYATGRGVPKDYGQAAKWFRLAANQGDASAQFHLGRLFAKGKGVPRDDVEAYKWYYLAAEQGEPAAADGRDLVSQNLRMDQIAEAKRRAAAFVTVPPGPVTE